MVALVVVTQTAATTRAFAEQGGYDVDAGRDFLAVGAGSVVAGLVGSFPVDASPPRTGAVATAGGRTQAGAARGGVRGRRALIPFADVLQGRPAGDAGRRPHLRRDPALHIRRPRAIARFDLFEFALTAVTLLTVVLIGVEQGIGVAVRLAILDRIRLGAQPQRPRARPRAGQHQLDATVSRPRRDAQPGVLAVLFATPLWYANAVHFREEVEHALVQRPSTQVLILDAIGMSDLDFTGSREVARVLDACDRSHIRFGVARAAEPRPPVDAPERRSRPASAPRTSTTRSTRRSRVFRLTCRDLGAHGTVVRSGVGQDGAGHRAQRAVHQDVVDLAVRPPGRPGTAR